MSNKTPPTEANMVPVERQLDEIINAIDEGLGDSDPVGGPMTDDELRDEEPLIWACAQLVKLRKSLAAAPDQGDGSREEQMKRAFYVVSMELLQSRLRHALDDETRAAMDWGIRLGKEDQSVMFGSARKDAPEQAVAFSPLGKGWYVEVGRYMEPVVRLEETMLSGKDPLTDEDESLIRGCSEHLWAFIGNPAAHPPRLDAHTVDPETICQVCKQPVAPSFVWQEDHAWHWKNAAPDSASGGVLLPIHNRCAKP